MSSRIMGILATLAATILIVAAVVAVAGPLLHFGVLSAETLGEGIGWVAAGWGYRHPDMIWWLDGFVDTTMALGFGVFLFPRLLAADRDLERPDPPDDATRD